MNIAKVAAPRILPIRWETVTELHSGNRAVCASLTWGDKLYRTAHVPPANYTQALIELMVLMIRTEMENVVAAVH